jgi:ribose-phosphate pyrophosphokinase
MNYYITMPDDEDIKYKQFRYPGGEVQVRLLPSEIEAVKTAEHLHVAANITDGDIMPLALLTNALFRLNEDYNMQSTLFLPYLPYARADRAFVPGDGEGLFAFSWLINTLGYSEVLTLDVHNETEAALDINNFRNLSAKPFIQSVINQIGKDGLTVILPDKGASRYEYMLKQLGVTALYASKERDPETGKLTGFKAPVISTEHSKVLVVDDICDGGGTFLGLGEQIQKTNTQVEDLFLYVTHGIFSKGYGELEVFYDKIFTTDSFRPRIGHRPGLVEIVQPYVEVTVSNNERFHPKPGSRYRSTTFPVKKDGK